MSAKLVPLLLAPMLAACYGAAPPKPPVIPLPPVQEGAEILVHTETKTTMEEVAKQSTSCPQGKGEGDPSCTIHRYTVSEPVTRTKSTASYGDQPLNFAQFRVMTDPKYGDKVAAVAHLSHTCQRANMPRYVGIGLTLVGLVGGPLVAKGDSTAGKIVGYGGIAGGISAYALGYFSFGGRDCNEARMIYNSINYTGVMSWNTVEGTELATEMATLADQFNATHRGRTGRLEMRP